MGRPPKYASQKERAAAHRAQKLAWYHDRVKLISCRRKRARTLSKIASANDRAGICNVEEHEGSWVSQHMQHLASSLEHAPPADNVDDACAYWRLALDSFTEGDLRAWNMDFLDLLLNTPDDDSATLSNFDVMCKKLDRLGDVGSNILQAAFERDPSGRGDVYREASSLERYMRKLSSSAGEMNLLRRESRNVLEESKLDGSLICQTM